MSDAGDDLLPRYAADFGGEMRAYARRRVGDAGDELVQDTLLAAQSRLAGGPPPDNPRAWLFAMLRNKCVDHIRRASTDAAAKEQLRHLLQTATPGYRRGVMTNKPAAWDADPQATLERKEFWTAFDRCVDAMPLLMRQAFVLREIDGAGTDEVCGLLGISKSNLWVLVHRARLRLREDLQPLWTGDV